MTETDERYTPEHIFDAVRRFGPIGCDPCTIASNPAGARTFYTLGDSCTDPSDGHVTRGGLGATWDCLLGEVVWVNPPYSRGQLRNWVGEINRQIRMQPLMHVIALLPCDLGTTAGQMALATCDAICAVRGRLTFSSPGGKLDAGAKQPSLLFYWGDRARRFADAMEAVGTVFEPKVLGPRAGWDANGSPI